MKKDIRKLLNDIQTKKSASAQAPKKPQSYIADEDSHETYTPVGLDGLLAASEKLLAVSRGVAEPDDRDALFNDRLMTPDSQLEERIKLDTGKTLRNLMTRASRSRNLKYLKPGHFNVYTEGYLIGNPLVTATEQVNPMHMMEQQRRVTKMGPGGIGDPNAITIESQAVHGSQFGFVSPIEGPESSRAGIDVRVAHGTRYGSDGKVYQQMINKRTGKLQWVSPDDLAGKTMKLPD